MPKTIPLRCRCGAVTGHGDTAGGGFHSVCYCDDCQAFAHAIGRADILDAWGGSELWQAPPSQIRITKGVDQLRCLRLSDKGMLRFYTACCSTPVGNTMSSAKVPFVGVSTAFVALSPAERNAALGPEECVQGRFARPGVPAGVHRSAPPGLILRVVWFLLRGFLAGRARPSAFFGPTGTPVVVPRILTAAERDALRALS